MVVASGRVTAQSAANPAIASYTNGGSDSSLGVSMNMNVISASAISATLSCDYTDETNTARTVILPVTHLDGTIVSAGLVITTGVFQTPVVHIRVKAGTNVVLFTATGTYTSVSYNAEGVIQKFA
jgi:hypothetical protein